MIPVITIDGPSGVGKGTLAQRLAIHLHWHYLDSGALYRALAVAALQQGVAIDDENGLAKLAATLDIVFSIHDNDAITVTLAGKDVTQDLRTQQTANMASRVAAFSAVRNALLQRQQSFRQSPGLVTDGRDMGTVIFPDANLKFFLTASAQERAKRRAKQLMLKGIDVNLSTLIAEITERDERDANRVISPLKPAADAIVLDTTHLDEDAAFAETVKYVQRIKL